MERDGSGSCLPLEQGFEGVEEVIMVGGKYFAEVSLDGERDGDLARGNRVSSKTT